MRKVSMIFCVFAFIYVSVSRADEKKSSELRLLNQEFKRFVQDPHPMGSTAQLRYAEYLKKRLLQFTRLVDVQKFNVHHPETKKVILGQNIIAQFKGSEDCSLFIGGHYDTKDFGKLRFVGANDGGSSTVLKIVLAKKLAQRKSFAPKTWGACEKKLLFFDGEEAFLKDWNDGERLNKVQDNLYGSRKFVAEKMPKNPNLLLLIDMIAHKDQKLFMTAGSEPKASAALLKRKGLVDIKSVDLGIEDDHIPFHQKGVSFVHIIDWTNLKEWHTLQDDLSIVSSEKLLNVLDMIWGFLDEPRS